MPSTVNVWSSNHWTTREFPSLVLKPEILAAVIVPNSKSLLNSWGPPDSVWTLFLALVTWKLFPGSDVGESWGSLYPKYFSSLSRVGQWDLCPELKFNKSSVQSR